MGKRVRIAAMVLIFSFLLASLAYAGGGVTVKDPDGGEIWKSGQTRTIWIRINPLAFTTNVPVVKYSIFYTLDSTADPVVWKKITNMLCAPESHCYPYYSWSVPDVGSEQNNCKVKAIAYDADGNRLGKDVSNAPFTIKPFVYSGP